jgi:DNA repair protein RadD
MKLRPYQNRAVGSIEPWLEENDGNGLVVMATGTGKSITMGSFIKSVCTKYDGLRVLCVTHVADLVQGNHDELKRIWPGADAGIYSSKLKRRDRKNQVLFGMLQSIYKKAFKIQRCDILIVDEAHTISRKGASMWGQFIKDMKVINPDMRIIGFTATDYRLDSGNLIGGEDAMFHGVIYEYGLLEAINEGYLCEIIPKGMTTKIDLSGVSKRGGEFVAGELERAVDVDYITQSAVKELIEYGHDRKTWMIFCSGVGHCHHVAEEIRKHGIECEVVVGNTPQQEREDIYRRLKDGTLRAVCSVAVMTTGTNIPNIDLIGGLRPTGSAGLLVQMAGRGTRLSPGKKNCLYLDWAGNIAMHGPLDKIRGKDKNKKDGDGIPPMKTCPECASVVFAGKMICPDCEYIFPPPEPKINAVSDNLAVLSTQKIYEWYDVSDINYSLNAKEGKTPTMRVDYYIDYYNRISEWICFEHQGYAHDKAIKWWRQRSERPLPLTVKEALQYTHELPKTTRLYAYKPDDRKSFPEIKEYVLQQIEKEDQPQFEDDPYEELEVEIPW